MNSKRTNKVNLESFWIFLFIRICPTPLKFIPLKIPAQISFCPGRELPSDGHVSIKRWFLFRNFGLGFPIWRICEFENFRFSKSENFIFRVFVGKRDLQHFWNFFRKFFILQKMVSSSWCQMILVTCDLCNCHMVMLWQIPSIFSRQIHDRHVGSSFWKCSRM